MLNTDANICNACRCTQFGNEKTKKSEVHE